jgi:hypothetical protein
MVKKVVSHQCEKCGCTFEDPDKAEECEGLATPPFKFKAGERVVVDDNKNTLWEIRERKYRRSGGKHKKSYLIVRMAYTVDYPGGAR